MCEDVSGGRNLFGGQKKRITGWEKFCLRACISTCPISDVGLQEKVACEFFSPLMSPKSNWRAWHQWRGTHSVWQCLPFIYLLCAMRALTPSSLLPSLWLSNPSSPLSLSPSPLRTYSPSLPPSPFSLYLPLSLSLSNWLCCSAFQSRRSHLEWSWWRQLFIPRRNTFRRIALRLKKR